VSRSFRYAFILIFVALAAAAAAVGGWRHARGSAPVSGPIIVISIDTLRADHLPVYGYTHVRTPAIDALAADGVVFERAYSHAPQTLPAHTAMLAGRLPFETGVRDNIGFVVRPGERLLPQMLREHGFTTGGIVSAYVLRKETGIGQGFDFFDDEMPSSSPELGIGQVRRDGMASETIAEHWLDLQRSSRVFLFLHLYEPHKPYAPPERFSGFAPYDGEIAYSDEIVGRFVHYLKARQLYDRAAIVLVSDHGEGLGDHGEQEHGLFVYDEAIHVPLIIKQPENIGAGRRVDDVVQHLDLVPTILDYVKAPIPGNLHGRSLGPLLRSTGHLPEQAVYAEALYGRYHFGWSELTALTDSRYRYIKAPRAELYDLRRDPHERQNLAAGRGPVVAALARSLDRLIAGTMVQAPGDVSAETRARLQALGYVGTQPEISDQPGDALPDPKDKREILERYRAAVELAGGGEWMEAISLLKQILAGNPDMADVWDELATLDVRGGRYGEAVDAYRQCIRLSPSVPNYYTSAAAALLNLGELDEAHQFATTAVNMASKRGPRERVSAYVQLVRIALARHDPEEARRTGEIARQVDPAVPLLGYVEGRVLYDQNRYGEAAESFQRTLADLARSRAPQQILELHFYAADSLARLERYPEAEHEFMEELGYFPQNTRARAGLAMLYQAWHRPDAAARTVADLTRMTPTPESYALAARLWTMFGNKPQADAIRAQARRTFTGPPSGARATQH
jgi:arylsulfatase A-like enzyme/Tfp pilus assembly protein PilF